MKPGVQSHDMVVGTGDEAVQGKTVVVNWRLFLSDGQDGVPGKVPPNATLRCEKGRISSIGALLPRTNY